MSLPFSFSPSSLSTYRNCPRQFKLQKDKVITWKETAAKSRGTQAHEYMEQKVKGNNTILAPSGIDIMYAEGLVSRFKGLAQQDKVVLLEHEMSVTSKWQPCGWFDQDVLIRAKADVLVIDPPNILIGDYKTGNIYQGMDFQLRVYALLTYVIYGLTNVVWQLYYLDKGQTKQGHLDLSKGLEPVSDIISLMQEATYLGQTGGLFPAKQNIFCRFCDCYGDSTYCPESKRWKR